MKSKGPEHHLTTGLKPASTARIIQHFGEKITQKQAIHLMPCLWLTPVGEKIFLEEAADIRAYFHHIIGLFFTEFQEKYALYERACKQRLRILCDDLSPDMAWLNALEGEIATIALDLMQMRSAFLERFQSDKEQHDVILAEGLPQYVLSFICKADHITDIDQYMTYLAEARHQDKAAKRTLFGPHRVKWVVLNKDKNIDISFCSTGEQKAVLMSLLFVVNQSLMRITDTPPLILLDDAYAHFDHHRSHFVDEYLHNLPNNIFLTGTQFSIPHSDNTHIISVSEEIMQGKTHSLL